MFVKNDHRNASRELLELPVGIADGSSGTTRDISAQGVFFVCDKEQRVGDLIDMHIDLETPTGTVRLVAKGEIVRIEPQGQKTGIAVRLTSSRLEHGHI